VVFPGGIGAREVILIAVLSSVLPHGTAVAVAVMARVITTVADLACAGLGLTLSRGARGTVATTAVATTGAGPQGSAALPSELTSGALRQ
jgi:uncharacterized membrane protein YbhN (UPF0104 family)